MRNPLTNENDKQTNNNTNNNLDAREQDLIKVWTKMGASTGSIVGRLIGVSAALGLESIRPINEALSRNLQEMKKRIDP